MSNFELIQIVPDTHVPFHDKRAWELNIHVAAERQPDHYIKLGDWLDLYTLSRHMKDPKFRSLNFQDEIEFANALLDEEDIVLQGCKNKVYLAGNHEFRFDRYIAERAPELYGLSSIEKELNLKKRGWKYVPYQEVYSLGKMSYVHDLGAAGSDAHLKAEQMFCGNIIMGHTHRLATAVVGNRGGKPHFASMLGWLGDKKYADYMSGAAKNRYWSLGMGTGIMDKNGVTYVSANPIINYTVNVDGYVYGC